MRIREETDGGPVESLGEVQSYGEGRWVSCFQGPDGTIYLHGRRKTTDGGKTVVDHEDFRLPHVFATPEGVLLSRPGFFLALDGPIHFVSPGVYEARMWRSTDGLKTVDEERCTVHIPEGPRRERREDEWFGLYFHRSMLETEDGTLLATAEGNFHSDRIEPTDRQSRRETHYKNRSILLASEDRGDTWHYVSTVAAPEPEDPVGEGFDEPTMVRLDDGRLLCVMRTGHYSPLYACWSKDGGRTWSEPLYTGLQRGCDPCLLRLSDGRLALSYGKRFPEGWSRVRSDGCRWEYPGEGLVRLAVSSDGTGESWQKATLGRRMGSCYSTIFEVEPGVLFWQVDGWCGRVKLRTPPA